MHTQASVADLLLLESLPQHVQDAMCRVYGTLPSANSHLEREAYEAGWEDAMNEIEMSITHYAGSNFDRWVNQRNK